MCSLTIQIWDDRILSAIRPHRLEAQDGALSRPKLGFESPWGHKRVTFVVTLFFSNWRLHKEMLFESLWGTR